MTALDTSPNGLPLIVVGVIIVVVATAAVILVGMAKDHDPADTAVAYEHAWDRLDFATLWKLSSPTLRDGRTRIAFVEAKQAAYREDRHLVRLVETIVPEVVEVHGPLARVVTRLELADGKAVRDEVLLERVEAGWQVTSYMMSSSEKPNES